MLVKRESRAGVLFLFTTRPTLKLEWESRSNVTVLDLQKLPRRVTETLVRDVLGDTKLPETILQKIVNETDGNPLFVEELSKAVAESISESDNALTDNLVLPGTVQQSLASRIDRLNEAKPVLQLCSLLGRKFDYQLLRAVSQTENEAALRDELRTIVNAEFLFQEGAVPDSIYRFKHVLMQETAHNSLLKATRVELHAHVADIIESEFPERAERNPALLGFHYGEGEQAEKAVRYWTNACRKSLELFALREAIKQAQSGLQILQSLPDSNERDGAEIRLRSMLGKGLLALHGYADSRVEETFSRALELSESVENAPELFQVLVGLWMYFVIGGEAEHALVVARRLVRMADANPSVAKSLQAHYSVGHSLYRLGRYRESLEALENALSFDKSEADFASESASGDDTRVHVHCVLAHVFWHLGDDERSASHITNALDMATRQENLWGIEFSSFMGAWLFMLRREPEQTACQAERTLAIAEENGFEFWRSVGTFMATWASHDAGHSAEPDDAATRLTKLEETVTSFLAAGALNGTTSLGLQIAEDLVAAGEIDRAEFWLTKARDIVESSGERSFAPDLLRVEGQIARERGDTDRAEALFAAAESAARQVGSIGLARRAAAELAQGKGIVTTVQEVREPLH